MTGCDDQAASTPDVVAVVIDPDHPCPEWALAPTESSLWEDHIASEEPVPLALALPLPDGLEVAVTQGNHGSSHVGDQAFAYDFGVPLGTAVRAAAPGVVAWVEQDSDAYGVDDSFRNSANYVVLDHGGGLYTAYVHLAQGGVDVAPGDVVAAGERLGVTGLSGQLTGPHLHFHVENAWAETLPARFVGGAGCTLWPQAGEVVRADASDRAHLVGQLAASPIAPDTFAEDDVVDLVGLPARVLSSAVTTISGHVTVAASEVVMLFLPPDGGSALAVRRWPVTDGAFAGRLDLRGVAPGAYGVAFVAGDGGPVSVPRSVRAVVVDPQ